MRQTPAIIIAALFLVIAIGATGATAQFPMSDGPTADRARTAKVEDSAFELETRIASMRYLIDQAAKHSPERKKDPKLALAELQEDFTHLQLANKELVLKTTAAKTLDLKFVARVATEISKRAERLLANLALPETARPVITPFGDISDTEKLQASIIKLGWAIYWFTKNPIFKEAQVIDAVSAAKARSDLDTIIELSRDIRKSSERLKT